MSTENIVSNTDASASDTLHFIETPDIIVFNQSSDYSYTHNDKLSQSSNDDDDLESEFSVVSEAEFSDDSDYESHSDNDDDNLI
jgi:hypothetical protein